MRGRPCPAGAEERRNSNPWRRIWMRRDRSRIKRPRRSGPDHVGTQPSNSSASCRAAWRGTGPCEGCQSVYRFIAGAGIICGT